MANTNSIKRKALVSIANLLIRYVYRDPKRNMLRLVNIAQKVTGNMYPEKTFTTARDIITNKENMWHSYLFSAIDEIDHEILRKAIITFGIDCGYFATRTIRKNRELYKCNIPWVILLDPTSACNLKCKGCWSAEYGHKQQLSLDEMRDIVKQGKALGTHLYMFTGGEPLVKKKEILKLAEENQDCAFLAYTNATLIDEEFCKNLKKLGNFSLAISIEGTKETNDNRRGDGSYEKTMAAMDLLKKHKCLFGLSVCYTRQNCEAVLSDDFVDKMIEKGSRFAWYFHYMPVGIDADSNLMMTAQQRREFMTKLRTLRAGSTGKPMFTVDFQNDAEFVGGCIAGGRNYFHINSAGDIEPCVFIHYSDSNIRTDTLVEALKKPLFMAYYKNQPFNDNMLRPCPMLENPQYLRKMIKETGAASTDLLAKESVDKLCEKCDNYSIEWAPVAESIWKEKERFHPYSQYFRDTPEGIAEAAKAKVKNDKKGK